MSESYTTMTNYIARKIVPGLGDISLTDAQAIEVAQRMTEWQDGKLVERRDVDFWEVVAEVLNREREAVSLIDSFALLVPVQTGEEGKHVWWYFVRKHDDGEAIVTQFPNSAKWFDSIKDARLFARTVGISSYRVVFRRVTFTELVEE